MAKSLIPDDFKELLNFRKAFVEHRGPLYWLWVFDPQSGKVIVEHNHGKHRAEHIDHSHLAERVPHPDRTHGYAYKIQGGYRITDWEHRPLTDPFIHRAVRDALNDEEPERTHSRAMERAIR